MNENALGALYAALAKAQGEFSPLAKNREVEIAMKSGGRYKFRYADLEAAIAATRPALAKHGLAVIQRMEDGLLVTTIGHEDGGHMTSTLRILESYADIKQFGATITYLRRYAYCAMLCISADDDLDEDGMEMGSSAPANSRQQQRQEKQAQLPPYSAENWANNAPTWEKMIAEGKTTPTEIIKKILSRNTLSPEQIQAINSMGGQQ